VTLPDLHLAEDALAAYVDGILSPGADDRAARHLRACPECREAVDAEREAKVLLAASPDPELPAGLLARLLDVPMTADLGATDRVLAIDGDRLGWSTGSARVVERRATVPARPRPPVRPAGPTRPAGRSQRSRRTRRGLVVSLAGLAFGVIASAATTTAPGAAAPARQGGPPGTQTARIDVGSTSPMDLTRTFQFRRPATAPVLVPAGSTSPAR
jgi:anti-sigma factor RsiW